MGLICKGRGRKAEQIWRKFFRDPSKWWDHRLEKANSRYPDFKHKTTQQGLWLDSKSNPLWVATELATLAPGTLKSHIFSWNKSLAGYVKSGQHMKALELFQQMQQDGIKPDNFTFVPVLNACSSLQALNEGRDIHRLTIKSGFESDVYVGSCLVNMYAKCGSIVDAQKVFNKMPTRDVVSWNAMILGYVKCGQGQKALQLSQQMLAEGVEPDHVTWVGMLNACASLRALEEGRQVHDRIIARGCELDIFVGSSLIDMYAKCGSIEDAWIVFKNTPARDVIFWNTMILGCVKCGQGLKALELSQQMRHEGVEADQITFVGMLNACASVVALEEGRQVHKQIIRRKWGSDIFVGSSIVDMYAKCGSIVDARSVFNKMPRHDVVSWNAMLGGYAIHGLAKEAFQHFEKMSQEQVQMNGITFVSLLSACGHGGFVDEGLHYFTSMTAVHGVSPTVEHYACMGDLLGRAGRLHEAEDLVNIMTCEPSISLWMCLLGSCRVHCNVEMGQHFAKKVLALDPQNAAGYVLLSQLHAADSNLASTEAIRRERLDRAVKKEPRHTWIEVNNEVHSFTVDGGNHPQIADIYLELERLSNQIKEAGHLSYTRFELQELVKQERDFSFCHHSEKLAIAFGLLSTPSGTALHIFKNQRVCSDCHASTKIIAKMTERTIIVRDAHRFHHFKDGLCSCRDYW